MGTSGSFGGSGGKDAKDLRDNIADWLTDDSPPGGDAEATSTGDGDADGQPDQSRPQVDLSPALRVILRSRGAGGDGPSGGGGARGGSGGSGSGGSRSSGGARRSVGSVSRTTGRAGRLALAYATGDRETLDRAGLNYDELRALGDILEVGLRIVEAAFDSQADGTIEDSEERDVAAAVVEWILESSGDSLPSLEEIVRKAIETLIAEVALSEVGETIRKRGDSRDKREAAERMVRDVAEEYASQVTLSPVGATEDEISDAIEAGVRDIGHIFGVKS